MPTLRLVGPGRAGTAVGRALATAGWVGEPPLGRGDDLTPAAAGVDLLLIATPDAAVTEVARAVEPVATTVVAHLAGSLGLDALDPHPRRASLHPLVSIPTPGTDVRGAWFAVDGDALATALVDDLGGTAVHPTDRVAHHAAACVAANHLVALLGQVERIAAQAGVPLDAYLDLAEQALANVRALGPAEALTGPVARGDAATVERHRGAIDPAERPLYDAAADAARRLVACR